MATVQITTWDEFVEAWTETITEDTKYIIQNDIDVSGIDLTEHTYTCPTCTSGSGTKPCYLKTFINSDDDITNPVTINGITSNTSSQIFYKSAEVEILFKNINFTNINIYTGRLFGIVGLANYNHCLIFQNCTFSGVCNYLVYNLTSGSNTITQSIFYQCKINITGRYISYSNNYYYNLFSCCWIHFDKMGNTDTTYLGNNYYTNCYIEGNFNYNATNTSTIYLVGNLSRFYTCVFNCDVSIIGTSTPASVYFTYSSISSLSTLITKTSITISIIINDAGYYSLFNNDKLSSTRTPSGIVTSGTGMYKCTNSELQNVTNINTICPNFPLVE